MESIYAQWVETVDIVWEIQTGVKAIIVVTKSVCISSFCSHVSLYVNIDLEAHV